MLLGKNVPIQSIFKENDKSIDVQCAKGNICLNIELIHSASCVKHKNFEGCAKKYERNLTKSEKIHGKLNQIQTNVKIWLHEIQLIFVFIERM